MCHNIKPLFNFEPQASSDEMHDATLQFVRKISGYRAPSHANEAAFYGVVEAVERTVQHLLGALDTHVPSRDRDQLVAKARDRSKLRYMSGDS